MQNGFFKYDMLIYLPLHTLIYQWFYLAIERVLDLSIHLSPSMWLKTPNASNYLIILLTPSPPLPNLHFYMYIHIYI